MPSSTFVPVLSCDASLPCPFLSVATEARCAQEHFVPLLAFDYNVSLAATWECKATAKPPQACSLRTSEAAWKVVHNYGLLQPYVVQVPLKSSALSTSD